MDNLGEAGGVFFAVGSTVGKVEFFGGECHLGYGEFAFVRFRIDIPGIFKCIEIYAITKFAKILILDMARI